MMTLKYISGWKEYRRLNRNAHHTFQIYSRLKLRELYIFSSRAWQNTKNKKKAVSQPGVCDHIAGGTCKHSLIFKISKHSPIFHKLIDKLFFFLHANLFPQGHNNLHNSQTKNWHPPRVSSSIPLTDENEIKLLLRVWIYKCMGLNGWTLKRHKNISFEMTELRFMFWIFKFKMPAKKGLIQSRSFDMKWMVAWQMKTQREQLSLLTYWCCIEHMASFNLNY